MTDALAIGSDDTLAMTHWPEAPNPAAPYLQDAANFARGGVAGVMRGRGTTPPIELPQWLRNALDNPDNQLVMPGAGMAKAWAGQLEKLRKLGLTYSQIAERLGVTRNAVAGTMRDAGLTEKSQSVWTPEKWQRAKELRKQGVGTTDTARELGVSPTSVTSSFKRSGVIAVSYTH